MSIGDILLVYPKGKGEGKMKIFEMNGIFYQTDDATLEVLRSIIPPAKETGDTSAVAAVMMLGLQAGIIKEGR